MKMLGMLLICTASLAAALSVMKSRRERIRSLQALGRMLELMEGELASTLCPIPDLVHSLEQKSTGAAKGFLSALSSRMERLGKESFARLWTDCLRESLSLDRADLDALRQLGSILGQYDLDRQLEAIAQCREQLLKSAERLAADHRQKCRTGCGVALLSAAMLCIALL